MTTHCLRISIPNEFGALSCFHLLKHLPGKFSGEHSALDREGAGSNPAPGSKFLLTADMSDDKNPTPRDLETLRVNPGYVVSQLAKALTTSTTTGDAETRDRAKERAIRWQSVLRNLFRGDVNYGSRTPVSGTPAWVTLRVMTGGFATGDFLAGGALQKHESALLDRLSGTIPGEERRALNSHFLSESGLSECFDMLRTGCYEIAVPEEGALLVVAWLAQNGYTEEARGILEEISPYFNLLRFYPRPLESTHRTSSAKVHIQTVGATMKGLQRIKPNLQILSQRESVSVWGPFYDRIVNLFLETMQDGWPCRQYPEDWSDRALALLNEYVELREKHGMCRKLERPNQHYWQLRNFLERCAKSPDQLTGFEVGRIRLILKSYLDKHGSPQSEKNLQRRRQQLELVKPAAHYEIARAVIKVLEKHPSDEGLDDSEQITLTTCDIDGADPTIGARVQVPTSIQKKVARCLNAEIDVLVERGIISSSETLAQVLPQLTSGIRAAGLTDSALRQLYSSIYRAFRRRRSLLLLDLEKQVQIEELPWIRTVDGFRTADMSSAELAKQTLEEVTILALTSFPQAIIPNKLLQELNALSKGAGLDLSLVDELAADIFMGKLSVKFVRAALVAADLLSDSLYAVYYGIEYSQLQKVLAPAQLATGEIDQTSQPAADVFVQLCASRAGVELGGWDPAKNGMIIEQQQILTTQNLAVLYSGLELNELLEIHSVAMAKQCFTWICRRLQMKPHSWHEELITLKNSAYAWRQMVFYLAVSSKENLAQFLEWAEEHFGKQGTQFKVRFQPAFFGLLLAAKGTSSDSRNARCFLGWSKEKHWLSVFTRTH